MNWLKKILKRIFLKEPRFCVDCLWLGFGEEQGFRQRVCQSPKNKKKGDVNMVMGKLKEGSDIRYRSCNDARNRCGENCGPKGKWFRKKK
jgi:hypothetical protein